MASSRNSFHPADYAVFALSIVVSLLIGVFFAYKGSRTQGDYLMANRKMSTIPVSISLQVSFLSAILILGTPAEMYTQGTEFYTSIIGKCLGIWLAAILFVPLLYPLKCTSAYEYLQLRFKSRAARIVGSMLTMMSQMVYMAVASFAPSLALNAVTGFPVWAAICLCNLVATIYTCIGGIKAVVWTDVFQALIMMIGMIVIFIQGCLKVGGVDRVFEISNDYDRINFFKFDPDPTRRHSFWSLVFGFASAAVATYGTSQASVQRIWSLPTQRKAMGAVLLNMLGSTVMLTAACLMGLALFAYYANKNCDILGKGIIPNSNQIVPFFVMETLAYPTFPGIFMSSLFAGALSSISSSLTSLSTLVWEDFVKPHLSSKAMESRHMIFIRVTVVLLGIVATGLSLLVKNLEGTVVQMVTSLMGAVQGPLLGMFLLGAVFPWANAKGAVCGGVLGVGVTLWISFGSYIVGIKMDKFPYPNGTCEEYKDPVISMTTNTTTLMPQNLTLATTTTGSYTTSAPDDELSALDKLYSVSYLWYSLIGMLVCIISGLIVSFITGANSMHDVPTKYQIPLARRLMCCLPASWKDAADCHRDFDENKQTRRTPISMIERSEKTSEDSSKENTVYKNELDISQDELNKKTEKNGHGVSTRF